MKTLRNVLTVTAFVFAIAGAFASTLTTAVTLNASSGGGSSGCSSANINLPDEACVPTTASGTQCRHTDLKYIFEDGTNCGTPYKIPN